MIDSEKAQHREFVQSVITRMNTNSFHLKGLMITLVSAFLGVFASSSDISLNFLLIPIPLVVLFWFLDAYYLQLERQFRGIYNDICDITPDDKKETKQVFLMNPKLYKTGNYRYFKVLLSPSILSFYLSIIICLFILYYYLNCN